jgi:hypothetical protein
LEIVGFLPAAFHLVSGWIWRDVSSLEIVGFLPAAFHLVSGWIWRESDRKIPVSFRREYCFHFPRNFR